MNVAVIGAGGWGKNLVRTFNELGVLGAIVEKSPEILSRMKEEYPKVPVFNDISEISSNTYPAGGHCHTGKHPFSNGQHRS